MLSVIFRTSSRVFSHILLKVMKFFFISLGICLVALFFLSLRLAIGPLDITFLKRFMGEEVFKEKLSMAVDVDRILLKYNGVSDPLTLTMTEVTFFKEDDVPLLHIPKITIRADYTSLLKGDLKLKKIGFLEPKLTLSLDNKRSLSLEEDKDHAETSLFLGILGSFSGSTGNENSPSEGEASKFQKVLKHLEEISIENGSITLLQEDGQLILKAKLNVTLTHQKEQDPVVIFKTEMTEVSLCFPSLDKRTFQVPEVRVLGSFNPSHQTLEFTLPPFDWQGTEVKATGNGKLSQTGRGEIALDFESEALPLDQFADVWPENLAESTRSWILENLSKGNIDHIFVHLKGETSSFQKKEDRPFFQVTGVTGGFNINKMDVQYIEGLPCATEVFGIVRFDDDNFNIEIMKGHLEDIQVTKGMIHFYDLSKEDEMAEIRLTLKGSLQKILEVIDKKPLQYPTQLGIHPKEFQGKAEVNLLLNFPLLRHLTLEKVSVSTKSFLENVSYTHVFEQKENGKMIKKNLQIEKGSFDLEVDKMQLFLTGDGYLKGIKNHISWIEKFKEKALFSRKLSLKGAYPLTFFEDFGIVLNKFMTGTLGLNLVMTEKKGHFLELNVTGDLKSVDIKIPELNIHKSLDKPGKVSFVGRLPTHKNSQKNMWVFSNIHVEGPGIFVEGSAELDEQAQEIVKVDLSSFKTPRNNVIFLMQKIHQDLYQIKIRGKECDAAWFFKDKEETSTSSKASQKPELKEKLFNFNLDLVLDHVWLHGNEFIKSMTLDLKRINNRSERIISKGNLKDGSSFAMTYDQPKGTLGYHLNLQAANAGEFLRAIDLYDYMEGGRLRVEGKRASSNPEEFLEGRIFLDDFRVIKTPLFAKILSLASLDWMSDKLQEKHGILFRNASLEFKANENHFHIFQCLAESSSTGVTLKGEIDRDQNRLNLEGTIIPAYMFNSLIGHIPVLGQILSGGENKGFLAVTYSIKGPYEGPTVHVNPLSMLAPGFLRELF